ncbi:MAG: polyprenyl diphosphate synthase [Candidatus Bathyarchaeia archaeon]
MGITLAIIPDGNRRWAKKENKPILEGHRAGINKLKDLVEWCKDIEIDNLLIWIFSTENAGRSKEEVQNLFSLFDETIDKLEKEYDREKLKDVRLRFIGRKDMLPERIVEKAAKLEEKMKEGKFNLALLIGYGGRQEIIDAANKLIEDVKNGKLEKVDEKSFSERLYAPDIPDPDIIIRTGERRLSGLLPWQSVYSELYFIDKLWPEFTKEDLINIINDFRKRERRYGK